MIQAKSMAGFSATTPLARYSFERRNPKDHDVVIDIKFCGICHSDIHTVRSEWGPAMYPLVPGHEIAGIVRQVGSKVTKYKIGDRVGVGCFVDSCKTCENCKNDLDNYCIEGMTGTYNAMERDGSMQSQGGYSDVIVVDENYVLLIPSNISLEKAAPLLCAGITTYSPLKHWKAGKGIKVAVLGMGGLGHMAVKIAKAMGANVTVLSHSSKKQHDAIQMGADEFVITKDVGIAQKYNHCFNLIINTVSSAEIDMGFYFEMLKTDGTLVALGAPDKPFTFHPFPLIMQRRSYAGSVIGSIKETQEMLDFCGQHNITPEIEVIDPSYVNEAYERVLKSDVRYRFVMDMSKI